MATDLTRRLLAPFAQLREGESTTAMLMFAYSFLAMTAYNIIQPITRSKFISDLGADNIPYVQFAAGLLIGVVMQGYARGTARLPRRWVIPISQVGLVATLVLFWALFQTGQEWVSVGFYFLGLILGILLISQFWTLANAIYDPRQAKRLFGFIGGGAVLGGMTGAGLTALIAEAVGTNNLLLWSASVLALCAALVTFVLRRERQAVVEGTGAEEEQGVSGREALRLLRDSKQIQLIAVLISFAALGAAILDQQLNMATEEFKGRGQTDAITGFLAGVRFWLSAAGLVIQLFLTSRIHRLLGIGFALMILPVSLGMMSVVILANAALWAPALGSVLDRAFRYTVDKTTREILFLPLPTDAKLQAKPFVDVTVDRLAKGFGALLLLGLIQPWGLNLSWQQLSYVTVTLVGVWFVMAVRAKREYIRAFRRSIETGEVQPEQIRLGTADLQTVETLMEELAHPDERRVLYAIELLEGFDKRHLITPLLLHHGSPRVRARVLGALQSVRPDLAQRWVPAIERLLSDEDGDVRAAAVKAISAIRGQEAAGLMRPYLEDRDPRIVVTAAAALTGSSNPADVDAAEAALQRLIADPRDGAAPARREVAKALGELSGDRFRHLLIPLMYDADLEVVRAAVRSAGRLGPDSFLFVPALVSLLRNRLVKRDARTVLVGYGEGVVEPLAYFLKDQDEDVWVRRHVPATLAMLPGERTLEVLLDGLHDRDGFLRYKIVAAIEQMRRQHPSLTVRREPIEALAMAESLRHFNALTLHANLVHNGGFGRDTLLARALEEKQRRSRDRVFRLLGLIYPWDDIRAARTAIERGDARNRASAVEYLDNVLAGPLRRRVMLMVEDMASDERVRRANVLFSTRRRDAEDTLAQLIHDDDQVIAAAAIHLTAERGVWKLADDIEHALAHRDVRDWYVFEAASWALAGRRMPAQERRARWLEPLPAVEVADRLRRIPLFDDVSVDELFRIAGAGHQVRHEPGRTLYQPGVRPDALQFLMDGEVAVMTDALEGRLTAPAPLAFEEVLDGTPMRAAIRAADVSITLSLSQEEFLTLLSDNIELAHGLFKMLLDTRCGVGWRRVLRGEGAQAFTPGLNGLQAIDRVLILESSPLFSRARSEQLLKLAAIARQADLATGQVLYGESDDPAIYTLLHGSVMVEAEGEAPLAAGPGDSVGVYETLAGVAAGARVTVAEPGTALRLDRRELFDLLADNMDLLQELFSALLHPKRRDATASTGV